MAYYRKEDKTLLVIGNYQKEEQAVHLPQTYKHILLNNDSTLRQTDNILYLSGYQVVILEF